MNVWIPADVDLFLHCEDASLALDIVMARYNEFFRTLYSQMTGGSPLPPMYVTSSNDYGVEDEEEGGDDDRLVEVATDGVAHLEVDRLLPLLATVVVGVQLRRPVQLPLERLRQSHLLR